MSRLKSDEELRGIRGWLIVLAIGVVGLPGRLLTYTQQMAGQFQSEGVAPFVTQGSSAFDRRWWVFSLVETAGYGIAIFPALLLIVLFFLKHRGFPVLFVMLAGYVVVLTVARVYLITSTPTLAAVYQPPPIVPAVITVGMFGLWMAYVLRSRRVHLTFVRQFYVRPFFPFFALA